MRTGLSQTLFRGLHGIFSIFQGNAVILAHSIKTGFWDIELNCKEMCHSRATMVPPCMIRLRARTISTDCLVYGIHAMYVLLPGMLIGHIFVAPK